MAPQMGLRDQDQKHRRSRGMQLLPFVLVFALAFCTLLLVSPDGMKASIYLTRSMHVADPLSISLL